MTIGILEHPTSTRHAESRLRWRWQRILVGVRTANRKPPNPHAYTYADSRTHTNANTYTHADANTYTDSRTHTNANANSHADSRTHANTRAYTYPRPDSDSYTYANANSYTHARAYQHARARAAHAHTRPGADSDAAAPGNHYPRANGGNARDRRIPQHARGRPGGNPNPATYPRRGIRRRMQPRAQQHLAGRTGREYAATAGPPGDARRPEIPPPAQTVKSPTPSGGGVSR